MARPIAGSAGSIGGFISNFDAGAKPNLYEVTINIGGISGVNPSAFNGKEGPGSLVFQAKGAQLPESAVGEILVPYLGRQIKVPGDRIYQDWTVTVMCEEGMSLRREFDRWQAAINGHASNVPVDDDIYQWTVVRPNATVKSLTRYGLESHSYILYGIWPKEVAAIDLAYDNNDTLMEFAVTFAYSYHEPSNAGEVEGPPAP